MPRAGVIDVLLAYDVSWRSVLGPRPWVLLALYGPHAVETATALRMTFANGLAYITESTPDLAEKALQEVFDKPATTSPVRRRKRRSVTGAP